EYAYPFRISRYVLRDKTGGAGVYTGGNGVTREIEFLQDAHVTIVSDRRESQPFGLAGGEAGQSGRNVLIRKGKEKKLPGKTELVVKKGDRLRIETPGGGGYGKSRK
ncbi:MAG: hydantoinase B/oxoprolinase family protein, partial [Nitrospira sp. SB0666_bin_27]|nr:hydantoinase B/oxoprolinase family protein [Nitrospira sp. SB0666_bin_27]